MSKRIVISESEKKDIKKLYGLNEDEKTSPFLMDLLNKALKNSKDSYNDTESDDVGDEDSNKYASSSVSSGKIIHNFTGKEGDMVNLLINQMENTGIKNPYAQIGILSVISKESGFKMRKEISYCSTPDSRIISVFGNNRGNKCKSYKCDDSKFFECVYGKDSGVALGNTEPGDGYKYIGRGFNQLTGKSNYRYYGNLIGVNLESNPDLLDNPEVAAKVAVMFALNGKKPENLPNFTDEESAAKYFANINAGGTSLSAQQNAIAQLEKFSVNPDTQKV